MCTLHLTSWTERASYVYGAPDVMDWKGCAYSAPDVMDWEGNVYGVPNIMDGKS